MAKREYRVGDIKNDAYFNTLAEILKRNGETKLGPCHIDLYLESPGGLGEHPFQSQERTYHSGNATVTMQITRTPEYKKRKTGEMTVEALSQSKTEVNCIIDSLEKALEKMHQPNK